MSQSSPSLPVPGRRAARIAALLAAAVALAAPAAAHAGTAISSLPNLPTGARAGTTLEVGESGLPGQLTITQTFNGVDASALARLRQIRLSPSCGPGPSSGNPNANGPAINDPETPCTNPDGGVFGGFSALGTGAADCAGVEFAITAPDSQGQIDLLPDTPVYLRNGESCEIGFTFSVLKLPGKDTFPAAEGLQTTSVSAVRSEVVSDPGNPGAVGLQAAGLGSGDSVRIDEPPDPPNCDDDPPPSGCGGTKSVTASSPKLRVAAGCVNKRLRATVTGTGIGKVAYMLDGRVISVVKGPSPFQLNSAIRPLSAGKHRISARVVFKGSSRPPQVLSRRIARCRAPSFTG